MIFPRPGARPRAANWFAVVAAATAIVAATPSLAAEPFVAATPTARVEYWQQRLVEITRALQHSDNLSDFRIVFLGDSITDFWTLGENPWVDNQSGGLPVWNEWFGGRVTADRALNLGISGDRTEHVLFRLQPRSEGGLGELDSPLLNPDVVVLMVGINNTWAAERPVADSVFSGIRAVVEAVHRRKPHAHVVLESLLPTSDEGKNRDTVRPVNRKLQELAATSPYSEYVVYLDLYSKFVDDEGRQSASRFMDGLHPNTAGYRIWADALLPVLDNLRTSAQQIHRQP